MFTIFLILLILQCVGVINVSWWIVTISLWLPIAITLVIILSCYLIYYVLTIYAFIYVFFKGIWYKLKSK